MPLMPLHTGARLGAYVVRSALGTGGMGEVYAAYDPRLGREVAIKVLPPQFSADPDRRKRFEREARAVSSLHHPHICIVHDVGLQDGIDYFVMELVEGESLAHRLAAGPLPYDRALQHAIEIADALVAAHRLGVVHRDLKPANVMLTKTGAKLLDFGVAIRTGDAAATDATATLTEQGVVVGTPQYMAPEQIEGKPVDARTDIFAFGALVYEMVSGRRAFEAESQAGAIAAILKESPRSLSGEKSVAPFGIERVVGKCLAKDPDARWQTAQDLLDELKWIAGDDFKGQPAAAPRPARAAWIGAGAGALVITAAAWLGGRYWAAPPVDTAEMRLDIATPQVASANSLLSIALSPDGQKLAFVAETGGVAHLWVRSLDSGTAISLKGTEGATYPFWKPDGRSLGFFANGMLNRIDLAGGAAQALAPASSGRGGAWGDDGTIIFTPGNIDPMYRIPDTGGTPVQVTPFDPGAATGQRFPQFLPGGQHVLFFSMPENGAVQVAALGTGEVTRLFDANTSAVVGPGGHLLYVRAGTLYAVRFNRQRLAIEGEPFIVAEGVTFLPGKGAFSSSISGGIAYRSGERLQDQLVWVDRSGRRLQPLLPPDGGGPFNAELSHDGRVLFQRNFEGNSDIWLTDGSRGGLARATIDVAADWCPVWGPDGQRFAFASNRAGAFDLYEKSVGGVEKVMLASGDVKLPVDWSRDGRFLLYRVQKATRSDIWALSLAADSKPFPFVETRFDEREGQFSPDTRWVAYQSDESGAFQIYLQAFPGPGERIPVSLDGGTQPRWRADGRELFYLAPDETLMSVLVSLNPPNRRPHLQTPVRLFQTRISFGSVPGANRQQYAVAADGQRFLISVSSVPEPASAPPITMVLNWRAGNRTR